MGDGTPREVRFGLVMNGGVSLAVWMGGVTAEIDRARSAWTRPDAFVAGDSQELWNGLLEALDCKVVVDVIAGTSAGGLNGAVLGTAIARGAPLPDLLETWLDVGSIGNLEQGGDRESVLDGDLLSTAVHDVFVTKFASPPAVPAPPDVGGTLAEIVSQLQEQIREQDALSNVMSLYTTATSMHGRVITYTDSDGAEFEQMEYRVVCTFRRRMFEVDGFRKQDSLPQLARAARGSASFPIAFVPAFFNAESSDRVGALEIGPDMSGPSGLAQSRWVIDGGVLDNEPFEFVLREAAHRPVDGDVDRVVAYVVPEDTTAVPSPDPFPYTGAKTPGMIEAGLAAMNLPREANLANQLERMRELQRDVALGTDSGRDLLIRSLAGDLTAAADELRERYLVREHEAMVWEARRLGVESGQDVELAPVPGARIVPAPDGVRALGELAAPGPWPLDIAAAERILRLVLSVARGASASEASLRLSACLVRVRRIKYALRDRIAAAIPQSTALTLPGDRIAAIVAAAYAQSDPDTGTDVRASLGEVIAFGLDPAQLATVFASVGAQPPAGLESLVEACLRVEIVRTATTSIAPYHPVAPFRFSRVGAGVWSPLYTPPVPGADDPPAAPKLLGLRVGHFGGFLSRSWRAYDWMWGRMDGATHLVTALVRPEAIARAVDASGGGAQLVIAVEKAFGAGAGTALSAYLAADPADADESIGGLRVALTTALHLRIVRSEAGNVLEQLDAAMGGLDTARAVAAAPSAASDDQVTAALAELVAVVPGITAADLAGIDAGKRDTAILIANACWALANEPSLPFKGILRPGLRLIGDGVSHTKGGGPIGSFIRKHLG